MPDRSARVAGGCGAGHGALLEGFGFTSAFGDVSRTWTQHYDDVSTIPGYDAPMSPDTPWLSARAGAGVARLAEAQRRAVRGPATRAAGRRRPVDARLRGPGPPHRHPRGPGARHRSRPPARTGNAAGSPTTSSGWRAADWCERTECPDDGRGAFVALTPAGRTAIEQAAPGHVRAVRRLMFDALSDDEVDRLGTAIDKMLTRLEAALEPRLACRPDGPPTPAAPAPPHERLVAAR